MHFSLLLAPGMAKVLDSDLHESNTSLVLQSNASLRLDRAVELTQCFYVVFISPASPDHKSEWCPPGTLE